MDYCYPADSKVQLNLSEENGSDAQCANYRSGTLCGDCQPGFSLSLGSSRCISCSGRWPQDFISVSLAALVGGICLVTLMLMFNLTVAVGTLNGLMFYANIIHANSSMLFPSTIGNFKLMHGFIAWPYLDIGMDVCYFKGMDTYWKTWIQLRFPTYVILLVVMVMALSERSIRFTRVISKNNPVATLATLVLLSYAMFLCIVITALSYATLDYPNGTRRVWLPDAKVEYLSGRHIPLFIVGIVILVVGTAYTFLLISWQWLLLSK